MSHPNETCQYVVATYCIAISHLIANPGDRKGIKLYIKIIYLSGIRSFFSGKRMGRCKCNKRSKRMVIRCSK